MSITIETLTKTYHHRGTDITTLRGTFLRITIINLIGYSAMAGVIGGGGLGDLAYRYGYQRFEGDVMLWTIVVLVIIVQGVQLIGNAIARFIERR